VRAEPSGAIASAGTWPVVSAIVPTRHRPEALRVCVERILAQDYPGRIECVVVFDRQAPARPDVEVPANREVRVVENARVPGLAGARNTGAEAATGTWIAFCDDDDEWLPDKISSQIATLRRHPEASAASTGIVVVTDRHAIRRVPPGEVLRYEDFLRSRRMEVHSSTLLVERERFLHEIGPIDEEIPGSYGEDFDWILRAARRGPLVTVPRPLVRIHWTSSYFSERWDTIIPALHYQLRKHPDLATDRRNLARLYGQLAFAYAAVGESAEGRRWARRSARLDWRQPRAYLAYLVSVGVSPRPIVRVVNAAGRGI
jgi:glycosyltransferase involved in cell wall biosynthesis